MTGDADTEVVATVDAPTPGPYVVFVDGAAADASGRFALQMVEVAP